MYHKLGMKGSVLGDFIKRAEMGKFIGDKLIERNSVE